MKTISRRQFNKLAMAAGAGVLTSRPIAALAQQRRFDGVTLRVGVFGGGWKDTIDATVGSKLKALGANIEYVAGNPADNFAKVVAARGRAVPIDLMEIGPAERVAMTKNGFLEDLPVSAIPNLSLTSVEVTEKKAVAYHMVQNGILYRADTYTANGIAIPTRFEDLQDPKLAGRFAFPDVSNPQHWPAVASLAKDAGGDESTPEKGFDAVLKMKPLYYYAAATELAQRISLGDVIAAPWHAGMGVRLHNSGLDVGFAHPIVGSNKGEVEYNYLGIIKGSKNVEAATAFINFFLETQSQVDFCRPMGVVPVNREARSILMQDPVAKKYLMLSDQELSNAYTMDWNKVNVEKWRSDWAHVVSK